MRKVILAAMLGVTGAMTFPSAAAAAPVVADPAQLLQLMSKNGYTVEMKTVDGEHYLSARHGKESYKFSIFVFGCDDKTTKNCKSVQFFAAFTPKTKPTLEAMNAYASDNRWGRIYLDKDKDPTIEMDVDLEKGGMSEALYLDNLEYFEAVMNRFADFAFKD